MKYLIITAHPSTKGHTKKIAKVFSDTVKKEGSTAEIMNLYTKTWQQDFLQFEDIREGWIDNTVKKIQKKISEADCLVLVFPIWWNDAPAVLKNFFDVNMTPHFAYHYTKRGPVGELNKRGYIFATADGPRWLYSCWLSPLRLTWVKMRWGFCAVKIKKFTVFGMMRKKTKSDLEKMYDQVERTALKDVQKYSH